MFSHYKRFFSTAEINSTFYAFPKLETTTRWNKSLPDDFILTAKIPKSICQADNLSIVEENLKSFLHVMNPLKKKLGPLVMQLKPSFEKNESTREQIYDFISFFPHSDYELIVEFS